MGRNHFPPIKPSKPPGPGPTPTPGVPLIWWTENEAGRLTPGADGKTDAEKANVGIATLIIQRDNGTLWRVLQDKAPYTWAQVAKGSTGGDPFTNVDAGAENITEIKPWMRVIGGGGKTFTIAQMYVGDMFEIVDDERVFNTRPVTLKPTNGMKFEIIDDPDSSLVLDTIDQGATWRFFVVAADIIVANVP